MPDRALARLLGGSLDRRLAAGCPPEWSRPLAARAQLIVSLPWREALAADWERVVERLGRPAQPRLAGTPRLGGTLLRREAVTVAVPDIRRLIDALRAPLPVPARGVATASVLLTDGIGPLYNPASPVSITDAVTEAVSSLDPAQPLMHPARV